MPPQKRQPARRPSPSSRGIYASLVAQAAKSKPIDPFVIDDVDPPIVITAPDTIERQVGLAELFSESGDFHVRDARRILELICGDAFDRVWELFRDQHISVLLALIQTLGDHFGPALNAGAVDFPGGSGASST